MIHRITLILIFLLPLNAHAQSFSENDIERILNSYELGAYEEMQLLKNDLFDSKNGFKFLQDTPESSLTRTFIEFGRRANSPSIKILEEIAAASGFTSAVKGFDSLDLWALTHDRIWGLANSGYLTGWGLHSDDTRYNDPNYPDTLAFLEDRSILWAQRERAIEEFETWCESLCVNQETLAEDIKILAPRYVEVIKKLFPEEAQ